MPTRFPGGIDDQYSLLTAIDNVQTVLTADVAIDATTIYVTDASDFPEKGIVTIHDKKFSMWEKIYYEGKSGNSFIDLTRPDAQAWSPCDCLYATLLITEDYHNYLRDAIIELEKVVWTLDATSAVIVIDAPTGLAKFQDDIRSNKWVSVDRQSMVFSRQRSNLDTQYLQFAAIPTSIHSQRILRNSTITAISIQTNNPCNAWFRIRKNGVAIDIHSIQLSAVDSRIRDNITVDLVKGDYLQVYMEVTSGRVDYPVMLIEYANLF